MAEGPRHQNRRDPIDRVCNDSSKGFLPQLAVHAGDDTSLLLTQPGAILHGAVQKWAKAHFFVGVEGTPIRDVGRGIGSTFVAINLEQIREMAERVAASEGLKLIDVELKGGRTNQLLRIYIDKPQGVSHADCQLVSEQMSALLDVEDPFPGRFTLEVSSPGLERELISASDYKYFVGRKARLVLREPLENGNRVLEGRLAGLESGRVRLDTGDDQVRELDLARIAKAKLVLDQSK
ncbi:MAG: ribosome maturation factor RimP [Terriglobia bacterium]